MVTDLVMPRYSLTMKKGTIIKWLKEEGEPVSKGEPVVEVEADKVTTEVEAPASGVLLKICAQEQREVPVGKPIAFIGEPGEPVPEVEVGVEEAVEEETAAVAPARVPEREEKEALRVRASPLARKLAENHGIDITLIPGTGPGGRVTREDVLQYIELHKDIRAVKEVIPIRGIQKTIAEHMSLSVKTVAHCSITLQVDASRIVEMRRRISAEIEAQGKRGVSYTDILVKAAAKALKENPIVNSTLDGEQLKVFDDVNIGVAVDVEGEKASGLLVPVIRHADQRSLLEISEESKAIIERARTGKATHEDLTGGTFTITNLGMFGIETFVPIINYPETAILGVGAIVEKPIIVQGEFKARPLMNLTLSFDHRVVNGAPAARFMQRLKKILEEEITD